MYDRIIRADLYYSERWLDLPSDTHRLVFNMLLHEADDFGNLEGGARRMWRWMHAFSQVKNEADSQKVLSDLADADLLRRYVVDGKEFWHIPRFRNDRRYTTRKYPRSPWCSKEALSTAEQRNKKLIPEFAGNLQQTSGRPAGDLPRGVVEGRGSRGVGEGLGRGRGRSLSKVVKEETVGAEPLVLDAPASPSPCVLKIPLIDKTEFEVTKEFADELVFLYPAVDVMQTLNEIRGWNLTHPTQRKTRRGILAHINTWMQREQNRG